MLLHAMVSGVQVNYSAAMRERLSRGRPDLPLVIHVGRIAIEKNAGTKPPLPCVSTAFVAKTLPLPCVCLVLQT